MNEKLLKNINHYGLRTELRKLNEECYELIEAIKDYEFQKEACESVGCSRIHVDKERKHVVEEIADVQVLLNQFKLYYGISDEEVKEVMIKKIDRQMERIKERYIWKKD